MFLGNSRVKCRINKGGEIGFTALKATNVVKLEIRPFFVN